MQVHDRYLIYTPPTSSTADAPAARPLTPPAWQAEMSGWLALHDPSKVQFTPLPAPPEVPATPAETDAAIAGRDGRVLRGDTFLKADQYPGLHRMNLAGAGTQPLRITGAPNYRQVEGENIHGLAQPTIEGAKGVLERLGAGPGQNGATVQWTNLREEPVVYVNGRPFNVRDKADWTRNVTDPGASPQQVEDSDARLADEVRAEAARNGGRVLLTDEAPDGRLVSRWEPLETLETPRQAFERLRAEGWRVDYARIPVTDEKPPEEKDFDEMVDRMKGSGPEQPTVFNCHAGRGRTTTGLVMAGLLRRAQEGVAPDEGIASSRAVRDDIKEQGGGDRHEYKVILSLIGTLEREPRTREEAEAVVGQYSGLKEMRTSILGFKEKSQHGETAEARDEARLRGEQYLDRYFYLVAFDTYAKQQAPHGFEQPFSAWMKERPELYRMRDDVQAAMGFRHADA